MDERIYRLAVVIPIIVFFVVLVIRSRKKNSLITEKTAQLKSLHKREAVFLCNFIEEIDGESINASVRPGMKINISGTEYVIKEVYADDKTPDKPDLEVAAGVSNTPIVIEKSTLDWKNFHQSLKRDLVVPLKLR